MRQCLVILAKTPIFSDVKTRLKSKIGKKNTLIFYKFCRNCVRDLKSKHDYDMKIAIAEKTSMLMVYCWSACLSLSRSL